MNNNQWQFWIDVGGTFTDCIGLDPQQRLHVHKRLSSGLVPGTVREVHHNQPGICFSDPARQQDPDGFYNGWNIEFQSAGSPNQHAGPTEGKNKVRVKKFHKRSGRLELAGGAECSLLPGWRYVLSTDEPAPVSAVRWLMKLAPDQNVGAVHLKLGTTRATNALLERQGAPTAFVTTAGFGDLLKIGYQNRPNLFDLHIRREEQLHGSTVELEERLDASGKIVQPLDLGQTRSALENLRTQGIQSVAICLLHAYRNPVHETLVEEIARELGFPFVSRSSRLHPLPKMVVRAETTVVDAYLTPVLKEYLASLAARMPEARIQLMTSSGSLVEHTDFHGKDAVLSGPAGGVIGAVHMGSQEGHSKIIGFDMGGTSTDVCRFQGDYERRFEMELKSPSTGTAIHLAAPMLTVETVAAGGGSVCGFDGIKPVVGPRSAGADPGPACYGRGGPLCVTDINLFLGRLVLEEFPFPLDQAAVLHRLDELIGKIHRATAQTYTREQLAQGFLAIANANMVAPMKELSVSRGIDVRDHALVVFGGAGGQHACDVAAQLGIQRVVCSPYAGVLSAFGIGMSDVTRFRERSIQRPYLELFHHGPTRELQNVVRQMEQELRDEFKGEQIPEEQMAPFKLLLDLRYAGQETKLTVPGNLETDFLSQFFHQHERLYGFLLPRRDVEVYAARVELTGRTWKPALQTRTLRHRRPKPTTQQKTWFPQGFLAAEVFLRENLQPGDTFTGPAVVVESISTIVVPPGWEAKVTARDNICIEQTERGKEEQQGEDSKISGAEPTESHADPVTLELFHNQFASIAAQMGAMLRRTALSTNVKERHDYSCALFTSTGDLVVNAPHIPVHLGAMSACVKCLLEDVRDLQPGDVIITNNPFRGGSHLPDVTVITPVFDTSAAPGPPMIRFFTASRAHHAEIGGRTPGSMPAFSNNLAEEGILIDAFRFRGEEDEERLRQLFLSGSWPSRSVEDNVADIYAQVAANQCGARLLNQMIQTHGWPKVRRYMEFIQHGSERKMRTALGRFKPGIYRFSDHLDNGSRIQVCIEIQTQQNSPENLLRAVVDFDGTSPVSSDNFNANPAIVASAVLYAFRCLISENIPLNAGMLAPLEIRLPENCLLNPLPGADARTSPAVVGGNVETSQRIVDVLLGALGVVAASQGTMNNFLFGRSAQPGAAGFGYYETIGGGGGAGPGFHGADAVHTHMTNTRLTDPEVLEQRYPVRVRRCQVRMSSGGGGKYRGGNGLIREFEFLEPLEVSLLTNRRTTLPYGLANGEPGQPGQNLYCSQGSHVWTSLPPSAHLLVEKGDRIAIQTPGGGGYGGAVSSPIGHQGPYPAPSPAPCVAAPATPGVCS